MPTSNISRRWFTTAVLAASLAIGCGPKARRVAGGDESKVATRAAARPAIETQLPLARWVPADAEMVIVADSLLVLEQLSGVVEPLAGAMGLSSAQLFSSPWLREGIDPSKGVLLFSRGHGLTLLAAYTPELTATGPQHLDAWRPLGESGFAAAHWNALGHEVASDWFETLTASVSGASFSSSPFAAPALLGPGAVRGHLPVLPLLASAVGGPEFLSCLPLLENAGSLRLSAGVSPDGTAEASVEMPISPAARAVFSSLMGPPVRPGIVALRQTEAAHLSVGVDPSLAAKEFQVRECPELAFEVNRGIGLLPMSPPPRGFHVAGTRFSTSDLSGSVGLQLPLHNSRFIANQLGRIPARSLFESTIRINGFKTKKLSVPTMSTLYYSLTNSEFLFASKKSHMGTMLTGEASSSDELLAVGLWPARFPQLRQYLRSAAPLPVADAWTDLILRFEFAHLSLTLLGDSIRLDVGLKPAS